ncbi:MAG TPA: AraC family transcriptional regulator [Armatimonadota bacterium]|jgi:AraC-like DNA-binding protein
MAPTTRIFDSYYHTPTEMAQAVFLMVLRAGRVQAGPDYRIERRICAGHDLLLCMKGKGFVLIGGRSHSVTPGQLAWLNGHHPHAHWADPDDPWEVLWARIDAHNMDRICTDLEAPQWPVFDLANPRGMAALFRNIIRLMRTRPAAMEALMNAESAKIVAFLFESRHSQRARELGGGPDLPEALRRCIDNLSLYFYRPWTVEELAESAGMSVPHFFRCFRKATGATPINSLRRERINQAKRRLIESTDSIKEIAEQVGYSDQFYFSRDFKRYTGLAPSQFRQREIGDHHPISPDGK